MASSQSKDDQRPKSPVPSSSSRVPLKFERNFTPRTPFFSDLDEAFRKITSKKSSNGSVSQETSGQVDSSQDNSQKNFASISSRDKSDGIPLSAPDDVAVSRSDTPNVGRSLTDFHPTPLPTPPDTGEMPPCKKDVGKLAEILEQKTAESRFSEPIDSSANTVEKIVDGYATSSPVGGIDVPPRNGAVTRCGFRGEEERGRFINHRHFQVGSPPRDLPQSPTMDVHRNHRRSRSLIDLTQGSSPIADTTVSDSQHLLDVDTRSNDLRKPFFPSPLRLPPKKYNPEKSDEFYSDIGSSFDITNGSSDDPFKYDDGNYQVALYNTREKEVSQNLRRASKFGEGSGATIGTQEDSPYVIPSSTQLPAMRFPLSNPPLINAATEFRSKQQLGSTIQRAAPPLGYRASTHNSLTSTPFNKLPPRDSTGNRDWITEATSEVDFQHVASPYSPIVKETGSSIADSLEEDDEEGWSSGFNQQSRIIQHPAGKGQPESYELQTLKDTKQKIILPKTRATRVAAYPENSTRWFSVNTKENPISNRVRNPLPKGISNPFSRSESYKRADLDGNFKFKAKGRSQSKYEFRDSASDYGVGPTTPEVHGSLDGAGLETGSIVHRPERDMLGLYSPTDRNATSSSQNVEITPTEPWDKRQRKRHVDEDYPFRNGYWWRVEKEKELAASGTMSSGNGPPLSTKSKFDFELIPLDQAQRQNKKQRESGETDETGLAKVRYQRAISSASSQAAPGSSPIQPPLPIHVRRGRVAPKLSMDLDTSNRHSYLDIFQDLSSPFSATSRPNLTPTSSYPNKSLLGQNSSPMTPTTNASASKATKLSWLERYKPRLFPAKRQGRRIGTDQTIIHHHVDNESGLSIAALEALAEVHISEDARRRRRDLFVLMAVLGIIFPFLAIVVLAGKLNGCLISYTHGEVRQFTIKQRNFVRNAFLFQCCLYTIIVSAVIAVYTKKP